jgi:hypothetical protein
VVGINEHQTIRTPNTGNDNLVSDESARASVHITGRKSNTNSPRMAIIEYQVLVTLSLY